MQAGSGSFSVGTPSINLTYRRLSVSSSSYETKFYGVPRLQDGEVTFVSAAIDDSASVVMPAHQANDLLLILAVNTTSTSTPNTVAGWTTLSVAGGGTVPFRLAYKWAASNIEIAGIWSGSTRTTAIVYRNVRSISSTIASLAWTNAGSIAYNSPTQTSNAGSRGVLIAATVSNDGAKLLPGKDATTPITGVTTRLTSPSASIPLPAVAVHDFLLDPGQLDWAYLDTRVDFTSTTAARTWGIILQQGVHDLTAETGSFDTSLNGDVLANTLQVRSRRYALEVAPAITNYLSFFDVGSGSFTFTGSSILTHLGFYLDAATESYSFSGTEVELQRALKFLGQTTGFPLGSGQVDFARGYFTLPQTGVFTSSFAGVDPYFYAYLEGLSRTYAYELKADFIRFIIESLGGTSFTSGAGQVGFRNDNKTSLPFGAATPVVNPQGGSDRSNPSFLRPQQVFFNSVSKSRDLGAVNNFLGEFTGEIGAETGTQTLFFKVKILGPADLFIQKKPVNRYTDKQISIGILDANRKQIQVNDFGFAYLNEIENTDIKEFNEPLPAGTYYFTVSTSLWQTIPFSVSIQAIRFVGLNGVASFTMSPEARFAIAKLVGPATLSGPFVTTIPTNATLKRPTGAALLTSASGGTFTTPAGLSVNRLLPYGRLKMTHKIRGTASVTNANVATLSAVSPYGGYGGP